MKDRNSGRMGTDKLKVLLASAVEMRFILDYVGIAAA